MTNRGWGRPIDEPIKVPGGELVTLRDAGHYISGLPKKVHDRPEWQATAEALLMVVERDGPVMLAEIGIRRALNTGKTHPGTTPRRKRSKSYKVVR